MVKYELLNTGSRFKHGYIFPHMNNSSHPPPGEKGEGTAQERKKQEEMRARGWEEETDDKRTTRMGMTARCRRGDEGKDGEWKA